MRKPMELCADRQLSGNNLTHPNVLIIRSSLIMQLEFEPAALLEKFSQKCNRFKMIAFVFAIS